MRPRLGSQLPAPRPPSRRLQREFFIDNLLVRIHFINVMIRWTGLAPWEFEFPFPGSLTSTFLEWGEGTASRAPIYLRQWGDSGETVGRQWGDSGETVGRQWGDSGETASRAPMPQRSQCTCAGE